MESEPQIPQEKLVEEFINSTKKNIFLTGKAGTGKTTLVKKIIAQTHKNYAIVAPTGIAAIQADGVTIHSLFQLPIGSFLPRNSEINSVEDLKLITHQELISSLRMSDSKKRLLQKLELLIIDEVSMLRPDLLDAINQVLQFVRKNYSENFGGVQILFVGDLLQLPVVIKEKEWTILQQFYNGKFFYDAHCLKNEKPVYLELSNIYRQNDPQFITILNELRNNELSQESTDVLNKYHFENLQDIKKKNYVTLTTHVNKANLINQEQLNSLTAPIFMYLGISKGDYPINLQPVDFELKLKVGSQVMFTKNDSSPKKLFYNGKIGIISQLSEEEVWVKLNDDDVEFKVEKQTWNNFKYIINEKTKNIEEKEIGSFTQYPLKLAWAITIHKSQGLTFEKAALDISETFAQGQAYVALSRLKSLDGLILLTKINCDQINRKVNEDESKKERLEPTQLQSLLDKEKLNYFQDCFEKYIKLESINEALKKFKLVFNRSKHNKNQEFEKSINVFIAEFNDYQQEIKRLSNILTQGFEREIFTTDENYYIEINTILEKTKSFVNRILNQLKGVFSSELNLEMQSDLESELIDLEFSFSEHFTNLKKINFLLNSLFNKSNSITDLEYKENQKIVSSFEINLRNFQKEKVIRNKEEKKPTTFKKEKTPSHLISLRLFESGKTIAEIARERKCTESTIYGHISQAVALGLVSVNHFITSQTLELILNTVKEKGTIKVSELKNELGEKVSFNEIKLALASRFSE